jgi:hypothetical protein
MITFTDRIIRAAKLDVNAYEEVAVANGIPKYPTSFNRSVSFA